MIPAKVDSISITTIRAKDLESIVDWFDQHKQSFYTLGWCYLRNQQQMEELFYQSIIKVHKELPRFKGGTSFETLVTSIFIHTCRELSDNGSLQASEESEQHKNLFNALDQLKQDEKEALVLTYVKGLSHEETAHLLQISVKKMKELLFSGIQSLRQEMGYGSTFNGCKEYYNDYIDYLERTLERSKKIELEKHIYHCQDCQEDLAAFQDVMLTMVNLTEILEDFHVPVDFMENVKARLAEKEMHRQRMNKKRIRMGIVFASVFALLMGIGFFTGAIPYVYYTWTEENQQLRAFLQQGLGNRLNLEAESGGVKIKIMGAVADDVQTLVFYEIEDTKKDNQYVMTYHDGVFIKNQFEIMSREANPRYYLPDLESEINKQKKNVYQGKMSLPPLTKDNGTIKLGITQLQKLTHSSSNPNVFMDYKKGNWNFEIPVTKQPSVEYSLAKIAEIEGVQIRFDKLIIAPTATILQFSIHNEQPEKRLEYLNFNHLEVNNKQAKPDLYGSTFLNSSQDMNWSPFQAHFDPLFGEKPKKVNVQFKSIYLTIQGPKTIELDATRGYPQSFEYAGSTISIDKVEVGPPAKVVISNHEIANRAYEQLQFRIVGEDGNESNSMEGSAEGVLVDKNGVEYDLTTPVAYEKIDQPRYFITVQDMELQSYNIEKKMIPKKLEIYGYNTTKYLDDVVKIPLE